MGFNCSELSLIAQKKVLGDPEVGGMQGSGQGQVTKGHHIHMMHNGLATHVFLAIWNIEYICDA